VCLTATLSLCVELELRQMLNFIIVETLHASSDQFNLQYLIQRILKQEMIHESLVEKIV